MSWIDIAWPMMGGASLALGLVHLFSWFQQRRQREALVFVVAAIAVAVLSLQELQAMRSADPREFAEVVRWGNLTLAAVMISLALFVRLRFNAGRVWILGVIIRMRAFLLLPNFLGESNLHFREVRAMVPLDWLGVTVYAPVGTANPWAFAAQATSVLLLVYLVDVVLPRPTRP